MTPLYSIALYDFDKSLISEYYQTIESLNNNLVGNNDVSISTTNTGVYYGLLNHNIKFLKRLMLADKDCYQFLIRIVYTTSSDIVENKLINMTRATHSNSNKNYNAALLHNNFAPVEPIKSNALHTINLLTFIKAIRGYDALRVLFKDKIKYLQNNVNASDYVRSIEFIPYESNIKSFKGIRTHSDYNPYLDNSVIVNNVGRVDYDQLIYNEIFNRFIQLMTVCIPIDDPCYTEKMEVLNILKQSIENDVLDINKLQELSAHIIHTYMEDSQIRIIQRISQQMYNTKKKAAEEQLTTYRDIRTEILSRLADIEDNIIRTINIINTPHEELSQAYADVFNYIRAHKRIINAYIRNNPLSGTAPRMVVRLNILKEMQPADTSELNRILPNVLTGISTTFRNNDDFIYIRELLANTLPEFKIQFFNTVDITLNEGPSRPMQTVTTDITPDYRDIVIKQLHPNLLNIKYTPNVHLFNYNCWGDANGIATKLIRKQQLLPFIDIITNAVSNINVLDAIVFRAFIREMLVGSVYIEVNIPEEEKTAFIHKYKTVGTIDKSGYTNKLLITYSVFIKAMQDMYEIVYPEDAPNQASKRILKPKVSTPAEKVIAEANANVDINADGITIDDLIIPGTTDEETTWDLNNAPEAVRALFG